MVAAIHHQLGKSIDFRKRCKSPSLANCITAEADYYSWLKECPAVRVYMLLPAGIVERGAGAAGQHRGKTGAGAQVLVN